MLPLSILLLLAAGPTPHPAPDGWIFSTVGHSEWCPAGNVQLDVGTGDYRFTPRAARRICHDVSLRRPTRSGRLRGQALSSLRTAYERARAQGLVSARCEGSASTRPFVVSNGGTPVLVVTDGARTRSAPDELGCWSDAANALLGVLERTFPSA
jgi:hypothetical protein